MGITAKNTTSSEPITPISQTGTNVGADGKHLGSTPRTLAHRFLSSKEEETGGSPGVRKLGSLLRMKAWNQQEEGWEMPLGELSPPNWEQPAQLGSGLHECSSPREKSESLRF